MVVSDTILKPSTTSLRKYKKIERKSRAAVMTPLSGLQKHICYVTASTQDCSWCGVKGSFKCGSAVEWVGGNGKCRWWNVNSRNISYMFCRRRVKEGGDTIPDS